MSSKKTYTFQERSNTVFCTDCGRPLKLNVIERQPEAKTCFVCYHIQNGRASFSKRAGVVVSLKEEQKKLKAAYWSNKNKKNG